MIPLRSLRFNPLKIASAVLFILAPFLSWITVSAFGLTAESSLLDVAASRTSLSIPQALPLASVFSIVLLMIGGAVLSRTARFGLPIAAGGLVLFWIESSSLFGSPVSVIPVVVAPGKGFLMALVGVGVGVASFRLKGQDVKSLLQGISTREALTGIGLFVATISLALDGLNHASLGQLSEFVGTGTGEPIFHLGFLVAILLLVFLFSVRNEFQSAIMNSVLITAAFAFVIFDAAYHLSTGEVSGFLGHDASETMLHVSAYYGTALVVVGRISARTADRS